MSTHVYFCLIVTISLFIGAKTDECPPDREEQSHEEAKLHKDLFCSYNYDYRPVKDHKTSVNVKVRFAIKYISFDALEETFTVHSWVALKWKDEFMSWIPSNYGDIKEIQVESHLLWTPHMALFNADATSAMYQSDQFYTTCLLANTGTVTCVPNLAHTGICRTSLRRWPYDVQNCTMFFGSWMHTGEQVNFTFYQQQPVVLEDFQDGPGWKLLNVYHERLPGNYHCCPNSTYPMLKYTFELKREAAGPAAIVVVPSVIIVILTLTSLLLGVKDTTRLLLICFSLYGHFMFLTEIGYEIPKYSADTPIILLFLRDSMIVTLVGILETLLLMYLRRQKLPAPTWIVNINRLVYRGAGKYVVFTEIEPIDTTDTKSLTGDVPLGEVQPSSDPKDWLKLANLLNSVLFIIALLVYLVLICTYIPYDK